MGNLFISVGHCNSRYQRPLFFLPESTLSQSDDQSTYLSSYTKFIQRLSRCSEFNESMHFHLREPSVGGYKSIFLLFSGHHDSWQISGPTLHHLSKETPYLSPYTPALPRCMQQSRARCRTGLISRKRANVPLL